VTGWEGYTRRFIEAHKLDDEQQQKAWSVCHKCQDLARNYVNRQKSRFERLEARLNELQQSSPPPVKEIGQIRGELAGLMRPVDDIFENQLKPRLDRLLTREQRRQAEASSQPAKDGAAVKPGSGKP